MFLHNIVDESLYSVKLVGHKKDEFTRLFELWNNRVYLEEFFEDYIEYLNNNYWKGISIEEAVQSTINQALSLEQTLIEIAETGKTDRYETLSTCFRPLNDKTTKIESFEKNKAKSRFNEKWLRIYAIRIDANLFVVTGGPIKLTRTMNEVDYLLEELEKMDMVKAFLQNDENDENLEIFELF